MELDLSEILFLLTFLIIIAKYLKIPNSYILALNILVLIVKYLHKRQKLQQIRV
jgi:hypothetical protein